HWCGVAVAVDCRLAGRLVRLSVEGLAPAVVGGDERTARMIGLPVDRLLMRSCLLGGAAAGPAGMFELTAVQGSANAALIAGYGTSGIRVAFAARHHPLAIIVCAILLGGLEAGGGLLQRRLGLPDATTRIPGRRLFPHLPLWEAPGGRSAAWKRTPTAAPAPLDKGAL
ncbi:ABC transporter permease, partial [Pseudomonas syringae]